MSRNRKDWHMTARGILLLVLPVFLLAAFAPTARSEPYFVPIDGTHKDYKAEDWGYKVTVMEHGGQCHVVVALDKAAVDAFKGTRLVLKKGNKEILQTDVGLHYGPGGKHPLLTFHFDPDVIDGGELIVYSEIVKDRPVTRNFGGFSLSVPALLKKARDAEKPKKP